MLHRAIQHYRPAGLNRQQISFYVFGKAGDGKSTFINKFNSHLAKRSYEDERLVTITQYFTPGVHGAPNITQACNIEEFRHLQSDRGGDLARAQTKDVLTYRSKTADSYWLVSDTPGLNESTAADQEHLTKIAEHAKLLDNINAFVYLHNASDDRLDSSVKEVIDKYSKLLPKELLSNNLIVCFTNMTNMGENPRALATLLSCEFMTEKTPFFCFKNDGWCHASQRPGADPEMLEMANECNETAWKQTAKQYDKFIAKIASMPSCSTEALFIKRKQEELCEQYWREHGAGLLDNLQKLKEHREGPKANLQSMLSLLKPERKFAGGYYELAVTDGGASRVVSSVHKLSGSDRDRARVFCRECSGECHGPLNKVRHSVWDSLKIGSALLGTFCVVAEGGAAAATVSTGLMVVAAPITGPMVAGAAIGAGITTLGIGIHHECSDCNKCNHTYGKHDIIEYEIKCDLPAKLDKLQLVKAGTGEKHQNFMLWSYLDQLLRANDQIERDFEAKIQAVLSDLSDFSTEQMSTKDFLKDSGYRPLINELGFELRDYTQTHSARTMIRAKLDEEKEGLEIQRQHYFETLPWFIIE